MDDPLRITPQGAYRPDVPASRSFYYRYAQRAIRCDHPLCRCPAQGTNWYSFAFVDEARRFIYFAVPKCGSTAIRYELLGGRHTSPAVDPVRPLDDYVKFSFVRNPWELMVSNWRMFTTNPSARRQLRVMAQRDIAKLSSFEAFVQFAREFKNHHWQPQALFLPEKLDFVGKLETFDDDFNRLCSLLGQAPRPVPKRRVGGDSSEYWKSYTPELVDIVGEMYSADVQAFGYEFRSAT